MSDSNYFDDTLDSEFLDKVDALETEQQLDTCVSATRRSSDSFGEVFDRDDLQEIDDALARRVSGPSNPPEILARTASKTLQTTLWSGVVPESHTENGATRRRQPTGGRTPKIKTWDKTAFSKSGWRAIKPTAKTDAKVKTKGKGRANVDEEGGEEALLLDTLDIPASEPSDLLSYISNRSPIIVLTVEYAPSALH